MADARRAAHLEPGLVQRPAHPAGTGEGADRRPGRGKARQLREQFGGPHVGVFRRGKTVEKPGIDFAVELRQLLQGIPDQQRERDSAIGQGQGLETRVDCKIGGQQLLAERRQFWPQRQRALQVITGERVFLDTDEVQAGLGVCVLFEQLPGA